MLKIFYVASNKMLIKQCAISERQKRMAPRSEGESERKDEEDWQLKDVVFVEDVKTVPIGMILFLSCYLL